MIDINKMVEHLTAQGNIRIHGQGEKYIEIFPEVGEHFGIYRLTDSSGIGYNEEAKAVENAVEQLGGIENITDFEDASYIDEPVY